MDYINNDTNDITHELLCCKNHKDNMSYDIVKITKITDSNLTAPTNRQWIWHTSASSQNQTTPADLFWQWNDRRGKAIATVLAAHETGINTAQSCIHGKNTTIITPQGKAKQTSR